jgi:hypothetical protein
VLGCGSTVLDQEDKKKKKVKVMMAKLSKLTCI